MGVRVPPLAHNISDLGLKTMHTNASNANEMHTKCTQMERKDMEKIEKWKPHPTRKNIYINQKTGVLYKRTKVGSFHRIPQKMTEHQELEDFRRASGVVAMTSRSRGRVAPPSDQTLGEDHT